jgi:hypothetical protein
MKGTDNLYGLGVDGRMLIKWALKEIELAETWAQ